MEIYLRKLFPSDRVPVWIRKLATLHYLIANGILLSKNMVLIFDEPEANLHPSFMEAMANLLIYLANNGVQVFLATHSQLLTTYLSLHSEYKKQFEDKVDFRFFGLFSDKSHIRAESGDNISSIENNAILDEYARAFDTESALFYKSINKPKQ